MEPVGLIFRLGVGVGTLIAYAIMKNNEGSKSSTNAPAATTVATKAPADKHQAPKAEWVTPVGTFTFAREDD